MIPRAFWALLAALSAVASATGCVSQACLDSQRLQLEAMTQYRDEMAAYHHKVQAHLLAEKRRELDAALAASLRQAADGEGRAPVDLVVEKVGKRQAMEDEFRRNLARLDGEFLQRQAAFGRALDLAGETLDLLETYGRLGALVRGLFVREPEAQRLVREHQRERSTSHAGSTAEPDAGGD